MFCLKINLQFNLTNYHQFHNYAVLQTVYHAGHGDDTTPTKKAQNGCHGNAGCLVMGPRNLQFMAAYFKNAKSINFKIGAYIEHSASEMTCIVLDGALPNVGNIGQKGQGRTGT